LLKKWPEKGPTLLWTYKEAGTGYAAPAVIGDTVYTMGARKDDEFLIALDGKGQQKWAVKIGPKWDFDGNNWSGGPNSTPTVDKDLIFALGSSGDLICVTTGGELQWTVNLPKTLKAQVNPVGGGPENMGWGFCWSPLVDGDNLIITPGGPQGLFAALNKKKGNVVWQSKDIKEQCTYASPIVAQSHGVRQYIALVQDGCAGVNAKDGSLLWRYTRSQPFGDLVCVIPIFKNDLVWITGKGGCHLVSIDSPDNGKTFKAERKVASREMQTQHGGVVLVGDHLYGADQERSWKALEFANPKKVAWESGRNDFAPGAVIAANGMLYAVSTKGGVALIEADPKAYTEVSSFTLPEESKLRKPGGRVWSHPVVANGRMYLRDQELIFCYEVK
jgi:hypothetical protein